MAVLAAVQLLLLGLLLFAVERSVSSTVEGVENIADESVACWKKLSGVCVLKTHACPFVGGVQMKTKRELPLRYRRANEQESLCGDTTHRCCIPPAKEQRHTYRDDQCGIGLEVNSRFRVFGGSRALPGEFPWQVSIRYWDNHHCGGTLIHPKWVLTAAHCLVSFSADLNAWGVVAGNLNSTRNEGTEQEVRVKRIISHEKFNDPAYGNDIALLELATPMKMTRHVNYACLPNPKEDFENMVCTVSGFGATETESVSKVLLKVNKPIVSLSDCHRFHCKFDGNMVYDRNLCAGFSAGKRDACQGDSGGPFVCRKYDFHGVARWIVAGVVSYGEQCGLAQAPGIYTRVTSYLDWIEYQTNIKFYDGSHLTPLGKKPTAFKISTLNVIGKCPA